MSKTYVSTSDVPGLFCAFSRVIPSGPRNNPTASHRLYLFAEEAAEAQRSQQPLRSQSVRGQSLVQTELLEGSLRTQTPVPALTANSGFQFPRLKRRAT